MARVVVVTGASRGIGVAIARRLARPGSTLVLAARDGAGLERTAAQLRQPEVRVVTVAGDVGRAADREALVRAAEAEGSIDVLVNNAGVEIAVGFPDQSAEEIERQLLVNLHAPLQLARRVLPAMLARRAGAIVFVSSMSGKSPTPYNSIYAASKHGLNGFVSSLRLELEGSGVQAGVVCPSFVAEAGMWADTGVKAPALLREVPLESVVDAVLRVVAGEGEVLVTPGPIRPMLALADLWPGLGSRILRRLGVIDVLKERARAVQARRAAPGTGA
jgi:short-subunit dehydrogenase